MGSRSFSERVGDLVMYILIGMVAGEWIAMIYCLIRALLLHGGVCW